jgi:hypothetical protein
MTTEQPSQDMPSDQPFLYDLTIYRSKAELKGTCYIEICPTKYLGKHFRDGSLFIEEEGFGILEWAFRRYIKDYDHYGFNDFSTRGMMKAARDLEIFEKMVVEGKSAEDFNGFCRMATPYLEKDLKEAIQHQRDKLLATTRELINWIREKAIETKHFSILGI